MKINFEIFPNNFSGEKNKGWDRENTGETVKH